MDIPSLNNKDLYLDSEDIGVLDFFDYNSSNIIRDVLLETWKKLGVEKIRNITENYQWTSDINIKKEKKIWSATRIIMIVPWTDLSLPLIFLWYLNQLDKYLKQNNGTNAEQNIKKHLIICVINNEDETQVNKDSPMIAHFLQFIGNKHHDWQYESYKYLIINFSFLSDIAMLETKSRNYAAILLVEDLNMLHHYSKQMRLMD